ncbi:MAG TPA: hypothetical protein VG188_11645 [Solirubrobacteraceae bacterium]|jgi:hypothetical protein|nr:hypothetical protein [Solirubrobacteraceae bacterium]
MTGVFLLAWIAFPILMLVLCAGTGLGVRRICGSEAVPALLTLPVGLAVLVTVGGLFCYVPSLAPLAAPAFVVVGLGGLWFGRAIVAGAIACRGRGTDLWAVVAAFGAWVLIASPIVLSGKPGFTGYGHIVDISYEFDLAAHFAHSGRHVPGGAGSAYEIVMKKYLASGYPGGGTWTLGALSNLTPVDLSWLYQPFLAFVSAMGALSLYFLLGTLVENRPLRALGAVVSAQPNVLYAYALAGGIKELCTSCFLLLTAALLVPVATRLRPGRGLLAVPIALTATIASLSLTTLPWVGVLSVGVCATVIVLQRGRIAAMLASAQMALVTFVLSLPTLAAASKLLPVVTGAGPVDLGNLGAPVPGIAAAGVWITGDVRFPQFAKQGPSKALAIVVLVLAVVGFVFAIKRRAWSVAWVGVAGAVALYYVAHRYGPWIQFKADCLTAPITLLLAFAGAGALLRETARRDPAAAARSAMRKLATNMRWLAGAAAVLAALAIAAGVLLGNALLYHDTPLSPYARLHDLQRIGERFAGQGPTLTPDFEEYAEYYLRDDTQDSVVNGPSLGLRPGVNRATEPGGIYAYDMNEFALEWIELYRTIVMRRNPLASRPPANYRLVYVSPYYAVWRRSAPASTVYAHIPFGGSPASRERRACGETRTALRKAGAGARLLFTTQPRHYLQLGGSNMVLSGELVNAGGAIIANGAGRATREVLIPATETYGFFMGGSTGRPVDVSVDGRHVGTAAYQVSYPGATIEIGAAKLTEGIHRIEISRGGLSLRAGNGEGVDTFNRSIGPLVVAPSSPATPPLQPVSASGLARLCRSSQVLHWIEVVRPSRSQ